MRALTDENGTLVGTTASDAFGVNTSQSGVQPQPFGYAGQQVDSTGLVYLRARYYDPNVGRFMSQDTYPGSAVSPLSLNRYTYVLNSPTLTADPSGMCSNLVCQIKNCLDLTQQNQTTCGGIDQIHCVPVIGCTIGVGVLKNLGDVGNDIGNNGEDLNFASEKALQEHYGWHMSEFRFSGAQQYLQAARRFFVRASTEGVSKDVRAVERVNGELVIYRVSTKEFGILGANHKTIVTYFKPGRGLKYFLDVRRAALREGGRDILE